MTIGFGAPTRSELGLHISMILFQPEQPRKVYSKKYLHADEAPYFVSGDNFPILQSHDLGISLAICYELSVEEHAQAAAENGADLYIASSAKHMQGVEDAAIRLAEIAKQYKMPVLLSNSLGQSDNFVGAGKSAAWNDSGQLISELNDQHAGMILFDPSTQEAEAVYAT